MKDFVMQFPVWFSMIIIALLVGSVVYRLIRKGVRIKVGAVEIDAEDDTVVEVKKND